MISSASSREPVLNGSAAYAHCLRTPEAAKYVALIWADHWLWTDAAERKITNPRIKAIKAAAKANNW